MCNCAKAEKKRERVFDILNQVTGGYLYDVPESRLSDVIRDFRENGYEVQDLKITEEVYVKAVWVISE